MHPPKKNKFKVNGAKFETPFMIRQVETHLVFGPLSRHFPVAYVIFAGAVLSLVAGFLAVHESVGQYIGSIIDKLIYLLFPLLLLKMTLRQQAIIGWMAVKFALGIAAFMMATVGAGASFQRGQADAWPNLVLGLVWIPGVEFIPRITPHQRYVTLARIVLSIPCIYFGVKSGNWHW
jgi:hypothetical protein